MLKRPVTCGKSMVNGEVDRSTEGQGGAGLWIVARVSLADSLLSSRFLLRLGPSALSPIRYLSPPVPTDPQVNRDLAQYVASLRFLTWGAAGCGKLLGLALSRLTSKEGSSIFWLQRFSNTLGKSKTALERRSGLAFCRKFSWLWWIPRRSPRGGVHKLEPPLIHGRRGN